MIIPLDLTNPFLIFLNCFSISLVKNCSSLKTTTRISQIRLFLLHEIFTIQNSAHGILLTFLLRINIVIWIFQKRLLKSGYRLFSLYFGLTLYNEFYSYLCDKGHFNFVFLTFQGVISSAWGPFTFIRLSFYERPSPCFFGCSPNLFWRLLPIHRLTIIY